MTGGTRKHLKITLLEVTFISLTVAKSGRFFLMKKIKTYS
jgi:hypothetical protein